MARPATKKFGNGLKKVHMPKEDEIDENGQFIETDYETPEFTTLEEQLANRTVITDVKPQKTTTVRYDKVEIDEPETPVPVSPNIDDTVLGENPITVENPVVKTTEKHVKKDVPTFNSDDIYKSKIEQLTVEIDNLNGIIARLRQENEELNLKIAQTEFDKSNYLEQLRQVSNEMSRLRVSQPQNIQPRCRYNNVVDQNGYQSWN